MGTTLASGLLLVPSWVCWLIELHTFSLLSPGGIQFLGSYGLSGEKSSGKMRGDSFLKLLLTVAPQSLECILS